uniref:transcriptional regulator BetI n=1 Tax=Pararhizobium sp. IMCC3301 TaxID=3067904 RepID=UPI0027405475|nr:transcriptional regulator BetI [Pararhizobium sp. IMCC3301]
MPKVGMEPIRRQALIDATILEIGEVGSLEVTVGRIAKRAGVSSGLAHHYLGGKDQILLAAMRHILKIFGDHVRHELSLVDTPLDRLEAIITASFHPRNFAAEVVAAWLAFYVQAQTSKEAQRLLQVYARRLHSNLLFSLQQLTDPSRAEHIAQGLAAMIDGFYIRKALQDIAPSRLDTMAMVAEYLHLQLRHKAQPAGGLS